MRRTGGETDPHRRLYNMRTIDPVAEAKSKRLNLRVAEGDDALLRRAAGATGESLSEFLIASGRVRAERVLADRTEFVLSESDWAAFTELLDRPEHAPPAMVELFRRTRPA